MTRAVDYAEANRRAEARVDGEATDLAQALASDNDLINQMLESHAKAVRDLAEELRDGNGEAQALCERAAVVPDPVAPVGSGRSLLARAAEAVPRPVKRDTRNNGILPQPFALVRDLRSESGTLFAGLQEDALGHVQGAAFSNLPATGLASPAAVPCRPLVPFQSDIFG